MPAWTRTAVALLAIWLVSLGVAHGAWRSVAGIDAESGKPSLLLIGELDARTGLYARCVDGHAEMYLDGFDGGDFEIAPVGPVNLIITTDTGKSWSSEARYGREKSGYITTTWLTRETISAAVAELVAAKSAISISIEFADSGDVSVWDTDATGSTAAGKRFLEACPQTLFSGLPEPQAPPTAPDPPAVTPKAATATTWQTFTTESVEVTLVGELERGARLLATCDGSKNVTLNLIASDLPYQMGDVGLSLSLEIDGEDRTSTGEVFDAVEGLKGVAYTGDYVARAIEALGDARSSIKLMVKNYADDSLVEWAALDLQGLAAATDSFNATCFGTPPGEAVADAPTSTPAAPVWLYSQQSTPDGVAGHLLTGLGSDGSSLAFHCVPGRITSTGLFAPQGLLPGAQGDSLMLSVAIDGVNVDLFADVVVGGDGLDLLFNGAAPDAVERILASLRDGADKIDAFVTNQGTGGITLHRFVAEGASAEAAAFVQACG